MYVITFYSFKGGVGRTLALINAATELTRMGRRVLLVDFDLEAPGMETFNLPKPSAQTEGIVDYVSRYLETHEAPDVKQYIYESGIPDTQEGTLGKLWIMPAGKQDGGYEQRFNSINWQDLYEKHDGYLMFEDMKAQWKSSHNPDYVLIDSRTGHTDVGGICTRQLPDAVSIFFIPNQQNLFGLKRIVEDIRNETKIRNEIKGVKKNEIQLHFVMSNVPNIDDEEGILQRWTDKFQEELNYDEPAGIIHHYNSLALLNQDIFSSHRPGTSLAQEYKALVRTLIKHNLEDRDGVLASLAEINIQAERVTGRTGISAKVLEKRIAGIRDNHSKDGEVLYRLATIKQRLGLVNEALVLLTQAIDSGYCSPKAFLRRAELYALSAEREASRADILKALDSTDINYFDANRAIMKLSEIDPAALGQVVNTRALTSMKQVDLLQLAMKLSWSQESLSVAEQIYRRMLKDSDSSQNADILEDKDDIESELSLCLIGLGRYKEAMEIIGSPRTNLEEADIAQTFNYAMAEWAETGEPPKDLFQHVIAMEQRRSLNGPNYHQCLSISFWALGKNQEAVEYLGKARQQIKAKPKTEFSAWSYLRVELNEFLQDLLSLEGMLDKNELRCPLKSNSKRASQTTIF